MNGSLTDPQADRKVTDFSTADQNSTRTINRSLIVHSRAVGREPARISMTSASTCMVSAETCYVLGSGGSSSPLSPRRAW